MSRSQMCFDDISVVSRVRKRQCILQESFTYRIEERSILCMAVGALILQVGGERRARMWQLAIKAAALNNMADVAAALDTRMSEIPLWEIKIKIFALIASIAWDICVLLLQSREIFARAQIFYDLDTQTEK
jgi:hypothetical protein